MSSYDNLNLNICENLYAEAGAVTAPYYTYNHGAKIVPFETCPTGSSSITGLAFYTGGSYPAEYQGALFFADYSRRCIWAMMPGSGGNPNPSNIRTFVTGAGGPVQLTTGPGGDLFYLDINGGTIRRIQYDVPVAAISANPTSGPAPLEVHFSGAGSTHPDPTETLSYSWDLNGDGVFGDATTVQTDYTFTGVGSHTVTLRVTDTHGGVDTESVVISVDNAPPVPVISAPLADPDLEGRRRHQLRRDPRPTRRTGPCRLPRCPGALLLHHCPSNCHTHTLTVAGSSFVAPDHEYPSHLELKLTATDSQGLQASTSRSSLSAGGHPELRDESRPACSFRTMRRAVPRRSRTASSSDRRTPISAPSPQVLAGNSYEFVSWSDGGAASHNIIAPAAPATYTATFVLQPPPSSLSANPSPVVGGNPSTGTVVLSGPAPAFGRGRRADQLQRARGRRALERDGRAWRHLGQLPHHDRGGLERHLRDPHRLLRRGKHGDRTDRDDRAECPALGGDHESLAGCHIRGAGHGHDRRDGFRHGWDRDARRLLLRARRCSVPTPPRPIPTPGATSGTGNYSLTAVATDDRGATTTSAAVPITVNGPGPPPPPWAQQDVGAVGLPGSATYSNGAYTVVGSGANIAGTADGFQFVYQPMSGDGQIVARITGVQNTTTGSKGGIMIRESLAANSSNVAMILTGGNRFQFQVRASTGATTSNWTGSQTPPHWVKLVRSGNTFTAYRSSNGVTWTLYAASPVTVPMSANVYVGLVMSSNNNTVLGTATLDNVNVVSGPPNAPPSATITSPTDGASIHGSDEHLDRGRGLRQRRERRAASTSSTARRCSAPTRRRPTATPGTLRRPEATA